MKLITKSFRYKSANIAHYQVGEGRPLLILHGWGTSSRPMQPLAHQLASIRECHLIDLPGFGESDEPDEPWSVDDYADMVESFIREQGWDQTDLLVHSYGGRITLKLLGRPSAATNIRQVVITGGAGLKPRRSFQYYLRRTVATLLKRPLEWLPNRMGDPLLQKLRQSALWKRLGSSDYQKLSGVMRETFVKSVTDHLDDLLPLINHEVLLLWGENDSATPLEQGKRMEKGLRNATLIVVKAAGHYAFLDKPKEFAAIARAYYQGKSS